MVFSRRIGPLRPSAGAAMRGRIRSRELSRTGVAGVCGEGGAVAGWQSGQPHPGGGQNQAVGQYRRWRGMLQRRPQCCRRCCGQIGRCLARSAMVPDFARLGFNAEIPLPNQGFPVRSLRNPGSPDCLVGINPLLRGLAYGQVVFGKVEDDLVLLIVGHLESGEELVCFRKLVLETRPSQLGNDVGWETAVVIPQHFRRDSSRKSTRASRSEPGCTWRAPSGAPRGM